MLSDHFFVKCNTHVRIATHYLWLGNVTVHAGVTSARAVALEAIV